MYVMVDELVVDFVFGCGCGAAVGVFLFEKLRSLYIYITNQSQS